MLPFVAPMVLVTALPLLFMSKNDVVDIRGPQWPAVQPAVNLTNTLCSSCHLGGLTSVVEGGLLEPNPMDTEGAGFEIFYVLDGKVMYVTTPDFSAYSTPLAVAALHLDKATICKVKSMARSEDGAQYVVMTICPDVGFRPMTSGWPLKANSFSHLHATPAFWDHDDITLAFGNGQFVAFQITFQNQSQPKAYCDNVGLRACAMGYRRVVTLRTSTDGLAWSNDAACPFEKWDPSHAKGHFDPQFRTCARGWNASGMIVPDADDPAELEFYKLVALRVGRTSRWVGHALLYAPAPYPALGRQYGKPCSGDLRVCHGPHLGTERWLGPFDGALAELPLRSGWQRPFKHTTGRRHRLAPDVGEMFTCGGVIWGDHHIFLSQSSSRLPRVSMIGVPTYRYAGLFAPSNAEFSTQPFVVPSLAVGTSLWLNADISWEQHAGQGCDQGCDAYVMVEVRSADAASSQGRVSVGEVVPGFEKERCVLMNVDGIRLPLRWNGTSLAPLAGSTVQLRIYYRDATIFALGY